MPVTSETLAATSGISGHVPQFRPWQPRRWGRHNLPSDLHTVSALSGEAVIPLADLAYILNARSRNILEWRHRPNFPPEQRYAYQSDAIGYDPVELIAFLKTLPYRDQARVCPLLPLGTANALDRFTLGRRILRLPFEPTIKEVIVALAVLIATVALSLFALAAASGS
jgi:hypothetical protein